MSFLARRRSDPEYLDDLAGVSRRDLSDNLREIEWTNRWFGGEGSLRKSLRGIRGKPATVLDVGTGDGGTLARLNRWNSGAGGENWRVVGVDIEWRVLEIGSQWANRPGQTNGSQRTNGPRRANGSHRANNLRGTNNPPEEDELSHPETDPLGCVADGLVLPFADGAFDAVISLQTLHHLDGAHGIDLLTEMVRVSRGIIVVSDLRRSLPAYLGARVLAGVAWKNKLTRHDGPLSVERGFTKEELLDLGRQASVPALRVRAHGPFRWVLEGESVSSGRHDETGDRSHHGG